MKIESTQLSLAAQHEASVQRSQETLETKSFRQVFSSVANDESGQAESLQRRVKHMLEQLLAAILAAIDGKKYEEIPAADFPDSSQPAQRASARVVDWQKDWRMGVEEKEATRFCAQGSVCTADGRRIDFNCSLALSREHRLELSSHQSGTYELHDPLVIDFAGVGAELLNERIDFDLDADGKPEQIPALGKGCGYLMLDRNGNGRLDDGSELFGVASGDGFADLAQLDADGNGWVDEADPAFSQLRVSAGTQLSTLSERGIGALSTAAVHAPFLLKTGNDELLGQIRAAGVYLRESGEAGFMQQVDLAVSTPSAA